MRLNRWPCIIPFIPALVVSSPSEGLVPFHYQGEAFQTYYKIFGEINESRLDSTPLVVAHGGPGLTHDYLLPFADIANNAASPVILYDQIGNGKSTHVDTKPASFWSIDLFVNELVNLINYLQIQHSFNLVGHSWGGILASEFAVQKQPEGLKRLILTDSLASSELWEKSNMQLMKKFPEDVQKGLSVGMSDPPRYAAALSVYFAVHGCRVVPLPEEYVHSVGAVFGPDGDTTVTSAE